MNHLPGVEKNYASLVLNHDFHILEKTNKIKYNNYEKVIKYRESLLCCLLHLYATFDYTDYFKKEGTGQITLGTSLSDISETIKKTSWLDNKQSTQWFFFLIRNKTLFD